MPESITPGARVVEPGWIAPGVSFKNPDISVQATHARRIPWFIEQSWAAMPPIRERGTGPDGIPKIKTLNTQKPYWRRKYKNRTLVRLDRSFRELPTFGEVGLGANQETTPSVPSSERNFWGGLESIITAAGSIWQKTEALKTQQKLATEQMRLQSYMPRFNMFNWQTMGLLAIAGVTGYFILSRR